MRSAFVLTENMVVGAEDGGVIHPLKDLVVPLSQHVSEQIPHPSIGIQDFESVGVADVDGFVDAVKDRKQLASFRLQGPLSLLPLFNKAS
jgi:hypothetical protein